LAQTNTKTRNLTILGIVLIMAIIAVGANSSTVAAQPCDAQLGYPVAAAPQFYGSNVGVTVPVSATCSFYTGQLYAVGTAYTGYNSEVGTANTVLSAVYGYGFSGELQFSIPTSVQPVQFSVSIYNTPNGYYQQYYGGQPLAVTSESYVVSPTYQNYPTYPSYSSYQTYPTYPTYPAYPVSPVSPTYPSYPFNPATNHYYRNAGYYNYYHNGGSYNSNNQHCNNWDSCRHR